MSFINQTKNLYGARPSDSFAGVLVLSGNLSPVADSGAMDGFASVIVLALDFASEAQDRNANDTLEFNVTLLIEAAPSVSFLNAIDAVVNLNADFGASALLNLVQPAPILTQLPANAFKQTVRGKLLVNDTEIDFRQATYSRPKDNLGSSLSFILSKADLRDLPAGANYKFEIGEYLGNGNWEWTTILENGKLDSRALSRSWSQNAPQDSLSFSTLSDIEDRFQLCPRANILCFDQNKTQVSTEELEPLYDTEGGVIVTSARAFNGLDLYQALEIAFVEGCGFDSIEPTVPNFPLTRADFSVSQSYKDAVAPFIGVFKPKFIPLAGNRLRILDGTQAIPPDFEPETVTADDYEGIGLGKAPRPRIDGLIVQFQSSSEYGAGLTRYEYKTESYGNFGDPDYTETDIVRTFKDYKDERGVLLDSRLVSEKRTTRDAFFTTTEETLEEHVYDGQGKITSSNTSQSENLPTLPAGERALQTAWTQTKTYLYQSDPFNSRRIIPKRITTQTSGLTSVDSSNPYFGKDFKQNYTKADDTGNLNESMTSEFGALETVIETYTPIGNGQVRVDVSGTNHLRSKPIKPDSFVASGDVSLQGSFGKTRKFVVWRAGANKTGNGKALVPFAVGELPGFFAVPLAERILEKQDAQPDAGTVDILGWAKGLDRGVFATVLDRDGASLGKYLVEGFTLTIIRTESGQKTTTRLEVEQVG